MKRLIASSLTLEEEEGGGRKKRKTQSSITINLSYSSIPRLQKGAFLM
jgi:hypothetical protein